MKRLTSPRLGASLLTALVLIGLLCCKGNSPTEASGRFVGVTGIFEHTKDLATIRQFQVFLGDSLASEITPSSPSSWAPVAGTRDGYRKGSITVRLRIANQTSSPNTYVARDMMIEVGIGGRLQSISLPNKTASLATGGEISYTVDLP